jgi:hypothetical protein
MQLISDALRALLVSKLQIGSSGYAGRLEIGGVSYPTKSLIVDKSLRNQADQMIGALANEALDLGWGATNAFPTNTRVKAFQWYGDPANEVQTFDGLLDNPIDHRDVITMTLNCRDRFALLIDQTFSASDPQAAGETGAVRTEDNGVYLNREVSYIVNDILDRVGWPTADRNIADTSLVLSEFIIGDGSTYADAITAENQLTTLTGYSAWSDELGVFQFQPTPSSDIVEVPNDPTYTWQTGVDITELNDSTDQYELITRVKATGPLTTTTTASGWHLLWQTTKIPRPVGIWYDPTDPLYIRVISSSTKKLYKLRDSDRQIGSSVNLGAAIPYPLGLSGDPSDSTHYYVLNAPWKYTGSTSGNSVKKVRKSDNVVVATLSLPNGRWSALKLSASFMWLTNLDTDQLSKRDKTTAASVATYQPTVNSVLQTNPSGLMIDGTTLHVFWTNGGSTARFLVSDMSAPNTITSIVATAGTTLHGGEMNTTTHTECWGDNDSLGLTAKFSLVTTSTGTIPVTLQVVDTDLEDELGTLAELEDRVHDSHPLVAAHPWESRRLSLNLDKISSAAQAGDIAKFWLDKLGRRRRVLDVGIIGNPAVQKNDLVRVEDPKTGIAQNWVLDTVHTEMDERGYLGTVSLVRGGVANDEITEPDPPPSDGGTSDAAFFYTGDATVYGDTIPHTTTDGFRSEAADAVNIADATTYHVHLEVTYDFATGYAYQIKWESDPLSSNTIFDLTHTGSSPGGAPLLPDSGPFTDVYDFDVTTGSGGTGQAAHNPFRITAGAAQSPHGHSVIGHIVFDIEPA